MRAGVLRLVAGKGAALAIIAAKAARAVPYRDDPMAMYTIDLTMRTAAPIVRFPRRRPRGLPA
jgi:hypothetical protein